MVDAKIARQRAEAVKAAAQRKADAREMRENERAERRAQAAAARAGRKR